MSGIVRGKFVGQEGGNFPIDVETFQQMQDYIDAVAELSSMYISEGMEGAILKGCALEASGTRRGAGWLVLAEGLVYYEGGLVADGLSVIDENITIDARGTKYDAYVRRRAVAGNVHPRVNYYLWDDILDVMRVSDACRMPPVGSVVGWLRIDRPAPDGWLYCDGKQYRVDEYRKLYDVIGDKFTEDGLEGTDVFNVPTLYVGNANIGVGYYMIRAK